MTKLLFLAGSARKESLNKKLASAAANLANQKDVKATYIDLADFDMPIYNEDIERENGLPENAKHLKKLFQDHDGFFIASPEYNSSFSALLKNALDWISRPHEENEPGLTAFRGKVAALGAVSLGAMGGLRGLVPLRMVLGNIGVHVIPTQIAVGSGLEAFNENGLVNEAQKKMLDSVITEFVNVAKKLNA